MEKRLNAGQEAMTTRMPKMAQQIYGERITSRADPSRLPWLNQLLKCGMLEHGHVENAMYTALLSGSMSSSELEAFLRPYYWGSSQGFNKTVLPAALKAHCDENWRSYIKSIIREENTPSCHSTMFLNFVESLGFDVGDEPEASQRFVERLIAGYSAKLGFALGYALGVETEADFQISVIYSAFMQHFPQITRRDEFFATHMSEYGEEAHAKATCESIEALIADGAIARADVTDGFNAAIVDTRDFVCEIHVELSTQAA